MVCHFLCRLFFDVLLNIFKPGQFVLGVFLYYSDPNRERETTGTGTAHNMC